MAPNVTSHDKLINLDNKDHGYLVEELISFLQGFKGFGLSIHKYYKIKSDFEHPCYFKDFFEYNWFIEIAPQNKIGYII